MLFSGEVTVNFWLSGVSYDYLGLYKCFGANERSMRLALIAS